MPYHGVVSKGCEYCRAKKVKCDQKRPACLRCQRAGRPCCYRSLTDVMFRDENERVIRKVRQSIQPATKTSMASVAEPSWDVPWLQIFREPSQPITLSAVRFFFNRYSLQGPPLSDSYHDWLSQHVQGDHHNHALVAAIEAIGLAGLSNVYYAPDLGSKGREQYGRALTAIKRSLDDRTQVTEDVTLMCIILLALYERVSFESMDQLSVWAKHIQGATALLQLRGNEQFRSPVGIPLYLHLRSQIFHSCIQQCKPVPPALLEASRCYQSNVIDKYYDDSRPGTLTDMSYRLANLRATARAKPVNDLMAFLNEAVQIDRELMAWRIQVPSTFEYAALDAEGVSKNVFAERRHVYKDLCNAQIWNNWRTLRILTNQVVLEMSNRLRIEDWDASLSAIREASGFAIREMSSDVCISTPSLMGTTRTASLTWPLYVVARETRNPQDMRTWATKELTHIAAISGYRQAGVLADAVANGLRISAFI